MAKTSGAVKRLFWEGYSRIYDFLWDCELTDAVADGVVARLRASGCRSVWDVGAGSGLLTRRLVEADFEVVAFEPFPAMRRKLELRCPDVESRPVPVEDIDLTSGEPDAVVLANVLHCLRDPRAVIRSIDADLPPDVPVIVASPDSGATVRRVAAAQRESGASAWRAARFLALHALLAPLTALSGSAVRPDRLRDIGESLDMPQVVGGVTIVGHLSRSRQHAAPTGRRREQGSGDC